MQAPIITDEEKFERTQKIYINYPRVNAIISKMSYCQKFSKISAEPECMFIYGPTGAGKTTLFKDYVRKYPRTIEEEGVKVPVLSSTIPSPATIKSLASKLLYELGDPAFDKGTISNQTLRLTKLIKDCFVEMIILDELQHFIDRDSQKVLRTLSDWLKTLILDTGVPIILIGLPESEAVLEANPQLSRRFSNRHNLEPFKWSNDKSKTEFRKFLYMVESMLPLEERSNLADENMAERFYYASDGVVAYVMKLVRYGVNFALDKNLKKLDLYVLADVFEQYVKADKPGKKNPFEEDDFEIGNEINKVDFKDARGTNKRVKPKAKKVKASDFLN